MIHDTKQASPGPLRHVPAVSSSGPINPNLYLAMERRKSRESQSMERRKPRRSTTSTSSDEQVFMKAAAWAWYQQGSGNERKVVPEFDLARSPRAPRPSRYRLEALRDPSPARVERSDSLLLDLYEVERITRELDRLISSTSSKGGAVGQRDSRRQEEKEPVKKRVSGFWMRHAAGICAARVDAVDAAVVRWRRRRPDDVTRRDGRVGGR